MKTQKIPQATKPKQQKLEVGGKIIKVGPGTVSVKPGKSSQTIIKSLREAAKKKAFPLIEENA